MAQDKLQQATERYHDACDAMRDIHARMREDLEFSNPSDPKQWPDEALTMRKGRPCYTFDRTNQFLGQVVNDFRQNKPRIQILPVDSGSDKHTAQVIDGLIRHIEYTSRADYARETALEHEARIGIGWTRIVPEIVRPETNEQEILIKRIHDPFSVLLDPSSVEPDGQDAMHGFVTTRYAMRRFKREFPKAATEGWPVEREELWGDEEGVTVCEYFNLTEKSRKYLQIQMPDGTVIQKPEDEFEKLQSELGFAPMVVARFEAMERSQSWCKMTGAEILEETTFPCRWVPLIPYYGDELWVNGKRHLSGLVRKLMQSQRAYNMERSAAIEYVALQPKAPFIGPFEAFEGHEAHWQRLNTGNPSFLPVNHKDEAGNPIPPPSRQGPPPMPAAFTALGQIASQDMEAAAGMHKANLGQQGNETSGRAISARQREGDTATFHYHDNALRSICQEARIIVDMLPKIYDQRRVVRIIGDDGKNDFVTVAPGSGKAQREGRKTIQVDLNAGQYDVRATAGASHATQRQEAAFGLEQILQAQPMLGPALVPALLELRDFPNAEKYARAVAAMSPPEVKAAMEDTEDGPPPIPPQVEAQMQQMQQQMEQMTQMLDAAEQELAKREQADQAEQGKQALAAQKLELDMQIALLDKQLQEKQISVDQYNAETQRLKLVAEQQSADFDRAQSVMEKQREEEKEAADESQEKAQAQAVAESMQQLVAMKDESARCMAEMMQAMKAMQQQAQELTGMVAEVISTVDGSRPASVEKVRDAQGRMVAARITQADGSTREVPIQ